MSEAHSDPLLRFQCEACGAALGVDPSLAGVKGPCPRCGEMMEAPKLREKAVIPNAGVTRSIAGGKPFSNSQKTTGELPKSDLPRIRPQSEDLERPRRRRSSSRKSSKRSSSESQELKVLVKILLAGIVTVLIVLAVNAYLKSY